MSYQCPRCNGAVQRASHKAAMHFGAVGAMISMAFGEFDCKRCGSIAKTEFDPARRKKMLIGSITLVLSALGITALLVWYLMIKD